MRLAASVAVVLVLLVGSSTARADGATWSPPEGWEPDDGELLDTTRDGPRFEGLSYFHPIRLHLSLGGHIEGVFGGVDSETGEMLLMLPTSRFRVSFSLIDSVTPLGPPGLAREDGGLKDILDRAHTEVRLVPTWRSHVGVALSFLAPGTGQFIQEKDRELGFLFMGLELFMAAGSLLAAFAAPGLDQRDRIGIAATFATIGVGISITAAVHAFQTGREEREIVVQEAPPPTSGGGGRP